MSVWTAAQQESVRQQAAAWGPDTIEHVWPNRAMLAALDTIDALTQEKAALEAISGKLRDLLVDASYLMQHFKEDDAAYRGWREKGKQALADFAAQALRRG